MRWIAIIALFAATILGGSSWSYADSPTLLHDLLMRGYEIKAEGVKANILTIAVQKGIKAFICASSADLITKIWNNKTVSATCVPL